MTIILVSDSIISAILIILATMVSMQQYRTIVKTVHTHKEGAKHDHV